MPARHRPDNLVARSRGEEMTDVDAQSAPKGAHETVAPGHWAELLALASPALIEVTRDPSGLWAISYFNRAAWTGRSSRSQLAPPICSPSSPPRSPGGDRPESKRDRVTRLRRSALSDWRPGRSER